MHLQHWLVLITQANSALKCDALHKVRALTNVRQWKLDLKAWNCLTFYWATPCNELGLDSCRQRLTSSCTHANRD